MLPNKRTVAIVLLALLMLQGVPPASAQAQSDLYVTSVVTKGDAVYNKPVQVIITVENIGNAPTTSTGFEVEVRSSGSCIDAGDDESTTPPNPPYETNPQQGCLQRWVNVRLAPGDRVTREFTWMPTGVQKGNVAIVADLRALSSSGITSGPPDDRQTNNLRNDLPPLFVITPAIEAVPVRETIPGRDINDAWRASDVKGRDCPTTRNTVVTFGCEALPGQVLNYEFTVHNRGNRNDIVVPSFVNINDLVRKGWEFKFTDDKLTVLTDRPSTLGVIIVIPRTAEANTEFNINSASAKVRITSGYDATVTTEPDDPTLPAIRVKRVHGLNVTHGDDLNQTHSELLRMANVTKPVRFDLLLNNSGNAVDRYQVRFLHGTGTINDSWQLPDIQPVSVNPGTENRTPLRIELIPPANATAGLHAINITIESTIDNSGSTFRELRLVADLQQNYSISGQVLTGLVSRLSAEPASFTLRLRNDGNGHDNVTLRLDPLPPGWTGGLSRTVVHVPPFGESDLTLDVTPPMNAPKDHEYAFFVNGTASGPSNVSFEQRDQTGMMMARVRIREGSNIAVTPTSESQTFVDPGAETRYTFRVTNTGNVRDRFTVTAGSESAAWRATPSVHEVDLEPMRSADVVVSVVAPTVASVGETNDVTVVVRSKSDSLLEESLKFAGKISGPDLFIGQISLNTTSPYAGDVVEINVPVGNGGNRAPPQNATLRLYLVQDGSETQIGERALTPSRLMGGVRLMERFVWNETLNHAGEGVLVAVVDPDDFIEEIEEGEASNEGTFPLTLRTFDLRVLRAQGLSARPGQEITYGEAPYTFILEHRGNMPTEPVRVLLESENGWGRRQFDLDLAKGVAYNVTIALQVPERPGVSEDRLQLTVIPRLRENAVLRASTLTSIIDDVKPEIAGITISPDSAVFGQQVRVSAVVRDATGLQTVRAVVVAPDETRTTLDLVQEGETDTWSATGSFTFAGTYRVFVEAVDRSSAGNANSTRDTVASFEVRPGTAPVIALADGQASTVRTGALVKLNLSDPNGIGAATYTIRGITYDLPPPYQIDTSSFPNGTLDVTVKASNIYGVESTETIQLTIDNAPPGVRNVRVTPEEPKVNEDVVLRIETDPAVAAVDVAIKRNGQLVETRSAVKERDGVFTLLFNPGEGDYTIDVSAKDAAGNVQLESGAVVFSAKPASFIPAPGLGLVVALLGAVAVGLGSATRRGGRRER